MKTLFAIALLAGSTPAAADVVTASSNGFEIRQTVNLAVKPEAAFAAFTMIGSWWDSQHTYSGDSANLGLSLSPGGCFCERFPGGGGIEHMRVTYVEPGKHIILTGTLGPLLYEATTGILDIQFKPVAGGTQVTFDYRAAGFFNGGAQRLAPAVDAVLGGQLRRFRTFAAGRPRT